MKEKSFPSKQPKKLKEWQNESQQNQLEARKTKEAEEDRRHQEAKDRENLDYIVWNGRILHRTPYLSEAQGIAREQNARVFWAIEGAMCGEVDINK